MIQRLGEKKLLVSMETSGAIDREAREKWSFNEFALIEAAGRSCAQVFLKAFPDFFKKEKLSSGKRIILAVGSGNNGADAMVMLRYWILSGLVEAALSTVVVSRLPKKDEGGAWTELLASLEKMKVSVLVWKNDKVSDNAPKNILAHSDLIIDGITGTGIKGPLHGASREMAEAINSISLSSVTSHTFHEKRPLVVSVDIPSGVFDEWKPPEPIIKADITLAIEPQKYCVYYPLARPYSGTILSVNGVFPGEMVSTYQGAELIDWEGVKERIPEISANAYKNKRGSVEVRAGSINSPGAAIIAARGAQAAGAGLIRIAADDEIYPILASGSGGIIVTPVSSEPNVFEGSGAILLGSGWGREKDRTNVFEKACALEKSGTPLILDADAIELAKGKKFSSNAILTPHPGEFSAFTGIEKNDLLSRPIPILLKYAADLNACILFKGHVIIVVAPDGRAGVIDGMLPGLASGGSGDLLAGFCAAISARMAREDGIFAEGKSCREGKAFDAYTCALAASALLMAAAKLLKNRFTDPMEIADKAADLAGAAWLGTVGS